MSDLCVCGHDAIDHDDDKDECREVCPCAGYTTSLADSNLSWHHALADAQARIAELEAALRRLVTCAGDFDATVNDFMDEACVDTEQPMRCARVRLMEADENATAALAEAKKGRTKMGSEEAVRAQRETRHWSQRAHRAEDLLRTWLATPFFADREEWAEWVREFRPAVERLLEEADNEDMPVLAQSTTKGDGE